jgi:hypothetical protein
MRILFINFSFVIIVIDFVARDVFPSFPRFETKGRRNRNFSQDGMGARCALTVVLQFQVSW